MIAAVYAAASLACTLVLSGLAWGPVQFRVSEALMVLALFTPDATWGLALGCALANVAGIAFSGYGVVGLLDVVGGSVATGLAAAAMWRLRAHPAVALAMPVLTNAVIVPLYMPVLLWSVGFTTVPFTSLSLEQSYGLVYLFCAACLAVGEAVVLYVVGAPLFAALKRSPLPQLLGAGSVQGAAPELGVLPAQNAASPAASRAASPAKSQTPKAGGGA
jgi:uncharacterized membrane protein